MLQGLYVKNLALIEEIEVEFGAGLNILSGETGAGKSIILGSINLALGGRYTVDLLREGSEFGLVELVFEVDEIQANALKRLDIYPEANMIILNRKLMNGRSISKINGETVTQGILKEVAAILIDIHGQHEHQCLLQKKNHLQILDEYMGSNGENLKLELSKSYKTYKAKLNELTDADTDVESRKRELSFLSFERDEIAQAHLVEGEDEALEATYRKMVNAKKITQSIENTYENTGAYGSNNASEMISRGISSLQYVTEYDSACMEFYNQLSEIDSLLNDFNRELSSYMNELEFSEEEFLETEERLNTWNHLKGKYGQSYELIMKYYSDLENKILKLEDYDSYLLQLNQEIEVKKVEVLQLAEQLSAHRLKHSKSFSKEVIKGLKELNFLDVKFEVSITTDVEKLSPLGIDDIGFLVSLNPGEAIKPLSSVVSGGELSRIMLVIKTVLSDKDQIGTMIFDEVDAGISGVTATKVGEKLALIGQHRQVICITHLAQIASLSTQHYIIEKQVKQGKTITNIQVLNHQESIKELARILGGDTITDAIMQSAIEMKNKTNIYQNKI